MKTVWAFIFPEKIALSNHWAGALEDGAFDVLDALHELPRAADVAKCALWALT
jgi:hypothetical protein